MSGQGGVNGSRSRGDTRSRDAWAAEIRRRSWVNWRSMLSAEAAFLGGQGLDKVQYRDLAGGRFAVVDGRVNGEYRVEHLEGLSPAIRAIASGRLGMVNAGLATACNHEVVGQDAVVGIPLAVELLQEGDGPAEVVLATTAVAQYQSATRARVRLDLELLNRRTGDPESARTVHRLASTFIGLADGLGRSLVRLGQMRTARREAHAMLEMARREARAAVDESRVEIRH